MLLNAAKCQDYSFYRFWVIKGLFLIKGGCTPPGLGLKIQKNWECTLGYIKEPPKHAISNLHKDTK